MSQVAWGISKGFDAKETARMAAQQALIKLGTGHPALAICFISHEFSTDQALAGLVGMLGNIPLWGLSTEVPLTMGGEHERSILVMMISGKELEAETLLITEEDNDDLQHDTLSKRLHIKEVSTIIMAGDGARGFPEWVLNNVKQMQATIVGCLSSGEYYQGSTSQFAGNRSEQEAVAIAALGGSFQVGVGLGHGWQDLGIVFPVGRFQDSSILEMDGVSPTQIYERIFGFPANEWSVPPLSEIIAMYPLGIEIFPGSTDLFLRAPVGVGMDGSLKFNAPLAEGQIAHIMVGDIRACLEAASQAILAAKNQVKGCRPLAVIVLMDYAWRLLFKDRIIEVLKLIQQGEESLPIIGAYTMGHVYLPEQETISQVLNQNIMVMILAEK
jgi:hypothetical protein